MKATRVLPAGLLLLSLVLAVGCSDQLDTGQSGTSLGQTGDGGMGSGPDGGSGAVDGGAGGGHFTLGVSLNPSALVANAGSTAAVAVTTTSTGNAPPPLALSVSGLPAGVTGAFTPASVHAGSTATLTLTFGPAANGMGTFTVTASAGSTTASASGVMEINGSGGGGSGPCVVTFEVQNAPARLGQTVYVVGNVPELGGGDTGQALPLSPIDLSAWTATVALTQGQSVQFKFFIEDGLGNITWEGGGSHSWTIPSTSSSSYVENWKS